MGEDVKMLTPGQRLKMLRKALGLTQQEMAEVMCCSRVQVTSIETEYRKAKAWQVRLLTLEKGVNPDWLMRGEGDMLLQEAERPTTEGGEKMSKEKQAPQAKETPGTAAGARNAEDAFWREMQARTAQMQRIVGQWDGERHPAVVLSYACLEANLNACFEDMRRVMERRSAYLRAKAAVFLAEHPEMLSESN